MATIIVCDNYRQAVIRQRGVDQRVTLFVAARSRRLLGYRAELIIYPEYNDPAYEEWVETELKLRLAPGGLMFRVS